MPTRASLGFTSRSACWRGLCSAPSPLTHPSLADAARPTIGRRLAALGTDVGRGLLGAAAAASLLLPAAPAVAEPQALQFPLARVSREKSNEGGKQGWEAAGSA